MGQRAKRKKENQFFLFHRSERKSYEKHSLFNFQTLHHSARDCLLPWSEIQILIFLLRCEVVEKFCFFDLIKRNKSFREI